MTPKRRGPHRLWTEAEDNWLRLEWGKTDMATLARWLQRTVYAISERAKKLRLNQDRKTLSLRAFAREAGVPISKVYWAMEQRNMHVQRVRRTSAKQRGERGSHFALTPHQQDTLLSLIKSHPRGRLLSLEGKKTPKGVWGIGMKPEACRECDSADKPHYAKGYCKACYVRVFKWQKSRAKNPSRKPQAGTEPKSLMVQHGIRDDRADPAGVPGPPGVLVQSADGHDNRQEVEEEPGRVSG